MEAIMESKKDDFGASLRQALADHPDSPVIVMVSGGAPIMQIDWTVCTDNCAVEFGQYLACPKDMSPREEWVYISKQELYDDLRDDLDWEHDDRLSIDELNARTRERMQQFEPYWRQCVIIRAY